MGSSSVCPMLPTGVKSSGHRTLTICEWTIRPKAQNKLKSQYDKAFASNTYLTVILHHSKQMNTVNDGSLVELSRDSQKLLKLLLAQVFQHTSVHHVGRKIFWILKNYLLYKYFPNKNVPKKFVLIATIFVYSIWFVFKNTILKKLQYFWDYGDGKCMSDPCIYVWKLSKLHSDITEWT